MRVLDRVHPHFHVAKALPGVRDPDRLGIRLIEGPLAGSACAIFQTSANRSGEPAPARFDDVDPRIVAAVDLALDGGELTGMPSTVVDLTGFEDGEWSILREGAVPRERVAELIAALVAGDREA